MSEEIKKSAYAQNEEKVLEFWKEKSIFQKSMDERANSGKEFVFYEGPPTANGNPGIHHLEARAFKDVIPRYKTMQGFHVRRKGGWDTHGLPVELQVEKKLGLNSKKMIEEYGVAKFNKECKENVWMYLDQWNKFTERIGYWVDQKHPYVTYHNSYIESLWNVVKKIDDQNLLYKDYKVVPWCPRCGTALSSHELAQGYEDVKDLSLYVKFKVKGQENTYILAWTTTPWTLPGNVALAVGKDIDYVKARTVRDAQIQPIGTGVYNVYTPEFLYIAKNIIEKFEKTAIGYFVPNTNITLVIEKEFKGSDIVGLEY
ncbi:MAG: class I tRNA ligase family protein, partial [Candidatus Paceibacterota bacterium]